MIPCPLWYSSQTLSITEIETQSDNNPPVVINDLYSHPAALSHYPWTLSSWPLVCDSPGSHWLRWPPQFWAGRCHLDITVNAVYLPLLNMLQVWKGDYNDKCEWQRGLVSWVRDQCFSDNNFSRLHFPWGNGVQMVRTHIGVTQFSGFFGKQLDNKVKYLAPHQRNKGLNCLITDIMVF